MRFCSNLLLLSKELPSPPKKNIRKFIELKMMVCISIRTVRGLCYGFLLLKVKTKVEYKLPNSHICLLDLSAKLLVWCLVCCKT
jgi:hypothetical protein